MDSTRFLVGVYHEVGDVRQQTKSIGEPKAPAGLVATSYPPDSVLEVPITFKGAQHEGVVFGAASGSQTKMGWLFHNSVHHPFLSI